MSIQSGAANPNWRGGRSVASNGYVLIRVGIGHRLADVRGYAYEHRLVAEAKVGRSLASSEHVHHVNGDKTDNRPENLEVLTAAEHRVEHRSYERGLRSPNENNPETPCACGCGATFPKYDASGRPRFFVSGHNTQQEAPTRDAVLATLRNGPMHRSAIANATERSCQAIAVALSKLHKTGSVISVGNGVWKKAE